jgi:hypothetical protein
MTFILYAPSKVYALWHFRVVPFQNIKTNIPAGDSGKGILYGVY